MACQRYLVVEHPVESAEPLPVHALLREYHWHRLDDTHVIVFADYDEPAHHNLRDHEKCLMLPPHHVSGKKQLHAHSKHHEKEHHWKHAKESLALDDHHTMHDLLEALESQTHARMMPW